MNSRSRLSSALMLMTAILLPIGCDKSKTSSNAAAQQGSAIRLMLDWKPEPEFGGFYQCSSRGIFRNTA